MWILRLKKRQRGPEVREGSAEYALKEGPMSPQYGHAQQQYPVEMPGQGQQSYELYSDQPKPMNPGKPYELPGGR